MNENWELIPHPEEDNHFLADLNPAILRLKYFAEVVRHFFNTSESFEALANRLDSKKRVNLSGMQSIFYDQGVQCKVLDPTSSTGWRSGKIRARVYFEFMPDPEPDKPEIDGKINSNATSPLDGIRSMKN